MGTPDPLAPEPPQHEPDAVDAAPPRRSGAWPTVVATLVALVLVVGGGLGGLLVGRSTVASPDVPVANAAPTSPAPTGPVATTPRPTTAPAPTQPQSCAELLSPEHEAALDAEFDLVTENAPGTDPEWGFGGFAPALPHYAMQLSSRLECGWSLREPEYGWITAYVTTMSTSQSESLIDAAPLEQCGTGLGGTSCRFEYLVEGGTAIEQHLFSGGLWIAVVHTVHDDWSDDGGDLPDRPWDDDFLPLVAAHLGVTS